MEQDILEKRWLEAQYYFLCMKIYKINNDIKDTLDFLEAVGSLYHYNIELSKYIATQLLLHMRYKPRKKETALLARHLGKELKPIAALTGYSDRQLFRIFKTDVFESVRYVSTFEEAHFQVMKDVLNAFEKLKELKSV